MSAQTDPVASRLSGLSTEARTLDLTAFWEVRGDIEPTAPRPRVQAHIWKWRDVEPRIREAATLVPLENAERRAFLYTNPGLAPKPYMTDTLLGACSLYNPGECAPAHRHTPSASRFLLEGEGGFTTVEGEKCMMSRGDLILTPNGTWHDHGNDGDRPIVWMDVLDLPLIESLNNSIFELDYAEVDPQTNTGEAVPRATQTIRHQDDHSNRLYGAGGMVPLFGDQIRGRDGSSPMFVYRGEQTLAQLRRLRDYPADPHDGVILEFVNPATGGPVVPTMSYRAQLLRPGEPTLAHRHTSSTVYCVIEGSGVTEVDGRKLEWDRNDAFVVPGWAWHSHHNSGSDDAVIYSVTDAPVLQKLDLYREERRDADGNVSADSL